jgi:hypothetical protein
MDKQLEAQEKMEAAQNRSQAILNARNSLLDANLQLQLDELESNYQLSDVMRAQLQFQNEMEKRRGTNNEMTDEEIAANNKLLEILGKQADLRFKMQMQGYQDSLDSMMHFGRAREEFEWMRELNRDPNLSPDQRNSLFNKQKMIRDAEEITGYIQQLWEGLGNTISESLDKVVTTAGSVWDRLKAGFSGLVTGIADMLYKLALQILQNYILTQLFGGMFNNLSGGLVGGLLGGGGGGLSLAGGADYVPRNMTPAMLHRGEAVLNREAASAWRSDQIFRRGGGSSNVAGGSGMVVQSQNVTINFPNVHTESDAKGVGQSVTRQLSGDENLSRRSFAQNSADVVGFGNRRRNQR